AVRRDAALAGHEDAPMHMAELRDRMCVWIDAENSTVIEGFLVPAPVKVEPPRMRVDFNGDAVFGAGFQHFVDVDLIAGAALKLTAGQVAYDRGVRIFDGFDDARGLLLLRHFEA